MVNLKELIVTPRRTALSYAELCPWFSLLPGGEMVLCQDSTLLAGFTLEGIDPEGLEDGTLNGQIDMLQQALSCMNENIVCWSYVEKIKRDTYISSRYDNPVAQRIEQDWQAKVKSLPQTIVTHSIFFGYRKTNVGDSLIENVNHQINEEGKNFISALVSSTISALSAKRTVASIRGHLNEYEAEFTKLLASFHAISKIHLGMRRLTGQELLGNLFMRMNLASPPGILRDSRYGAYIPQRMAADKLVRQGNLLRFEGPSNERYVSVMSAVDNPEELCSKHIDALLKLPTEFCICQIFEILEREKAQSMIQRMEMHYRMEVKSLGTRIAERISGKEIEKLNTGNLMLADDAQSAVIEITGNNMLYGFHSMRVMSYGETAKEANESTEVIAGAMRAFGYAVTRETTGLLGAFLSTLPGNAKVNPRKYLASAANIADLCPIRGFSRGEATHPFLSDLLNRTVACHVTFSTASQVLYGFNFHEADLGHTLLLGGSGAGKTTFLNLCLAMFQKYLPCNTFVFDRDYSTSVMSVLLGASHLDVNTAGAAKVRMNPVKRMLSNGDVLALINWVSMIAVGVNGEPLTTREESEINAVVRQVAGLNPVHWRLSTIYTQLKGINIELALKIVKYVDISNGDDPSGVGQYSSFFDNDDDAFDLTSFVCMETGKLLEIPDLAGPFLDYAFYAIDKTLNGSTPTMIIVEEASFALQNQKFYSKLMDWLRTLRKKKGFVVMVTQAMSELEKLPDISAFLVNLPTRIFLPSITNTVKENEHLYKQLFNLNDEQLDILAGAIPKRDYLIVKSTQTKLVQANMPDIVIAINNACANERLREKALEMAEVNQPNWQSTYLAEILYV